MARGFNVSYIIQAIDKFSAPARKVKSSFEKVKIFAAKAGREFKKTTRSLDRMARAFKRAGKAAKNAGEEMTKKVTAPLAIVGGLALKQSANMETLQVSFESMLGSVDKAKTLTEDLTKFTATTPFKFEEVGAASKQLLAFGVTQEEMIGTLRELGDIAAGTGAPITDIAAIFGKAKAKGKVFTEELNQLSERGIPILDDLAKEFGVSKEAIFKAASKGQISFKIMEDSFKRITGKGGVFFKQTEKQSETLAGLFSTLMDNVNIFLQTIGDLLVEIFNIKGGMKGLIEVLGKLPEKIKAFVKENPKIAKMGAVFALIATVMGPLIIGFGGVLAILGALGGPILAIVLAVSAVGAALFTMKDNWLEISNVIGGTIESIIINFEEMKKSALKILGEIIDFPRKALKFGVAKVKSFLGFGGDSPQQPNNSAIAGGVNGTVSGELKIAVETEKGVKATTTGVNKLGNLPLAGNMSGG